MDPNVQVAIATVLGTIVTTLGIVLVALINSRRAPDEDKDSEDKPSTDTLNLIQSLVLENARKEGTIQRLRSRVAELEAKLLEKEGINE